MSNEIFPLLPGLMWDIKKTPKYNTKIMQAVSGRELRASFQATPIYTFQLAFEFLRQGQGKTELDLLQGFFMARRGSFDNFLLTIPGDNQVTSQVIGVGDGTSTSFQLSRTISGVTEPVSDVLIPANGMDLGMWSATSGQGMWATDTSAVLMWNPINTYTISATGKITFSVAPPAGSQIFWTGTFYYRCRFKDDDVEFNQFLYNLWEAQTIDLVGSLSGKI